MNGIIDVLIIGAGTAGLSAAIYAARAGKKVLILEGSIYGGQIINTPEVANYPGIKKISGYEFASELLEQAASLGAEVMYERVTSLEKIQKWLFKVEVSEKEYYSKSIILSTGAKNRALGLEKEKEWIGAGISYCATCDGAFYRDKEVAIVGGGNTALEDAIFLSDVCRKVYVIHRRGEFRGEQKLQNTLNGKKNIEVVFNSSVVSLDGENRLEAIDVRENITHEVRRIEVNGLFIAIGQEPDNDAFANIVELDEAGYIRAGEDCKTNVEGIFVAGDCRTKKVRQLTTAAADGAVAALAACEYIE